jgi:hypothetical protein
MAVNYNQLRIDTPETRAALEQEYANRPRPTVTSQSTFGSAFGSTGTTPNYNPVPNVLTNTSPNPVDASFAASNAVNNMAPTSTSGFDLGGLLRAGGEFYLGQENIAGAQQLGREAQQAAQVLGEQAVAGTEFRPYTVTSDLANVTTTPEGGFAIGLSPEQQAAQQQLQQQATGLFGQVGVDPATAQAQLFEQMRAVQRPEEERQRLALEERLLSQGRLGLSSAAYGGASPELLAQETARQEAMARANLAARQQSQAEQLQAGQLGGMLQAAGYQPQAQALGLLTASQVPAGFADIGRRTGTELATQMGLGGLESRLQAEDLANRLQLQQGASILDSLLGREATMQEQLINRILDKDAPALEGVEGLLTGIVGDLQGSLPSWLGGRN